VKKDKIQFFTRAKIFLRNALLTTRQNKIFIQRQTKPKNGNTKPKNNLVNACLNHARKENNSLLYFNNSNSKV